MIGSRVWWLRRLADRLRGKARRHHKSFDDLKARAQRQRDAGFACLREAASLDAEADRLSGAAPDTGAPVSADRAGAPSPQS